jgi:hypothetical protein
VIALAWQASPQQTLLAARLVATLARDADDAEMAWRRCLPLPTDTAARVNDR